MRATTTSTFNVNRSQAQVSVGAGAGQLLFVRIRRGEADIRLDLTAEDARVLAAMLDAAAAVSALDNDRG